MYIVVKMCSMCSVAIGFRELTDESSSAHLSALPAPLIICFIFILIFLSALILSLTTMVGIHCNFYNMAYYVMTSVTVYIMMMMIIVMMMMIMIMIMIIEMMMMMMMK